MFDAHIDTNFASTIILKILIMKKFLILIFIVIGFLGCTEHTEIKQELEQTTENFDGVMLQNTLDVIKSMIVDDPTMINFIDASIVKEKDYLEDRVLFSDLFSDNTNFDTQQKSMIDANNFYDVVSY